MSLTNREIAISFYEAFVNRNTEGLGKYYHKDLQFNDPVFGDLIQSETIAMWTMLFEASDDLAVTYELQNVENDRVLVEWRATYSFGKKRRKVVNRILAELTIIDGLINRQAL